MEKRIQTSSNLKKILENLQSTYKKRGINLVCIKNRWSFRTADDLSKLMALQKSTHKKLSKATIETLQQLFIISQFLDLKLRKSGEYLLLQIL